MKRIVPSLALVLALAASVGTYAQDPAPNPLARGKIDLERCKNHFILSPDSCAVAQDASWVAAPDMHEARMGHSATLLNDGTVLVAGGGVASAEIYDPRDRTWTLTGPLSHVWGGHIATLLPSGKVLVLANSMPSMNPRYIDNSAEIYDPATRQWTSVPGMQIPRDLPSVTLLDTGKVLVVGGNDINDDNVKESELYDPETNTWSFTGPSSGRFWHTATKLRDGRVLFTGGVLDDWLGVPTNSTEIYDPATGTFTAAADMLEARGFHRAILLDDGTVLVSGGFVKSFPSGGGYCSFTTLSFAERYDPSTNIWSEAGVPSIARMSHTATLLPDHTVLLAGGDQSRGDCPHVTISTLQNSELSGVNALTWSHESSMVSPRADHTATLLPDGSVLVAGGRRSPSDGTAETLRSAELYRAPAAH